MYNSYMWYVIKCIGLFTLIGYAVYVTSSVWALLGLLCVGSYKSGNDEEKEAGAGE